MAPGGVREGLEEDTTLTERNERNPDVEALRERILSLSGAILRISASLDVDTVLREVVTSARALTRPSTRYRSTSLTVWPGTRVEPGALVRLCRVGAVRRHDGIPATK